MNFKLIYFRTIVSGLCLASIMIFGQIGCIFFGLFLGEFFFPKTNKKPLDEREKELSLKAAKLSLILIILFLMTTLQLTNYKITNFAVEEIIYLMAASVYFFRNTSIIYIFKKNLAL